MQFDSLPRQKRHNVNHTGLNNAISTSLYPPCEPKEGHETLHQQLITFHEVQNPIPHIEMIPKIWYFVCNFRGDLGRKGTM